MQGMQNVVASIRKARDEHHRECQRLDQALVALGVNHSIHRGVRRLSKDARERIAAAQRARWAKIKGKSKLPSTSTASKSKSAGIAGYWANMTPEERKAEVKRRQKLAAKKRAA
jgi:hypothetical protein